MAQLSPFRHVSQHSPISISTFAILVVAVACVFCLYLLALPKPIPGIPYNKHSATKLFGDVEACLKHIKEDGGTFATYCQSVAESLDAPLIQVFMKPFAQPLLVLSDFRETQSLMRRNEFDRSDGMADMILGLIPEHHMRMKTDAKWKSQRLLIKDLMLPSWLHSVAAPEIHRHVVALVELWGHKARLADGRAFEASDDLRRVTSDSVMSFCFGQRFQDTATGPAIEAVRGRKLAVAIPTEEVSEQPIKFPVTPLSPVLKALDTLFGLIGKIHGSPKPSLTWAYLLQMPRNSHAAQLRDAFISGELKHAVDQLHESSSDDSGMSAVHHMVLREKFLAEKEGREPQYLSKVMRDEVRNPLAFSAYSFGLTARHRYAAFY